MRSERNRQRIDGFSIIEILMVLAILSALIGIGLPTYREHAKRVDIAQAQKDLVLISQRLEKYFSLNSRYPDSLAEINSALEDPWGNNYLYLNKSVGGAPTPRKHAGGADLNTDYDLFSPGYDGQYSGTITAGNSADDVVRVDNGSFYGLAEDY